MIQDVAVGGVRRRGSKRALVAIGVLVPLMVVELATIPVLGSFAGLAVLVAIYFGVKAFPDALGIRGVGVTDGRLVLFRFGGWLRRASIVAIVDTDSVAVGESTKVTVPITIGPETVRLRRREVFRLGRLPRFIGYGYTQ